MICDMIKSDPQLYKKRFEILTKDEIEVLIEDLNEERHLELMIFSSQCVSIATFVLFSKVFKNCKKKHKGLNKEDPFQAQLMN